MTQSEYVLNADGTARDPKAFQAALKKDQAKLDVLRREPETLAVIIGDDIAALQHMLKSAFEAEQARRKRQHKRLSERTIDAQRVDATVPRDTVQLYEQLYESGLQYGPAFRLLRNVHVPDV
ncbi:hypothetical protein ABBQ32_008074 [Trebouxia sp. C0010 RCD-2024]